MTISRKNAHLATTTESDSRWVERKRVLFEREAHP
jgi:hypothetical protein